MYIIVSFFQLLAAGTHWAIGGFEVRSVPVWRRCVVTLLGSRCRPDAYGTTGGYRLARVGTTAAKRQNLHSSLNICHTDDGHCF